MVSELPQIPLQQGMRIEPDRAPVGDAVDRVVLQQRAKLMDSASVEPLDFGEQSDVGFERIDRSTFLLAGMDEHRQMMPEWKLGEAGRRMLDEVSTRERQFPDHAVAQEIVQHRRASTRRVEAYLVFGLEDDDPRMLRQGRCCGEARNAAPDYQNVGITHVIQAAVSRSFTTLPSFVRRMALTISSSSGSIGRPCSLSQKADRKL